jgi:hypothetical protein
MAMPIQQIETQLYASLFDFFKDHRFEMRPELKQFRRYFDGGFHNVIFSLSEFEEEAWLEVNLGVRINMVEELVQQFLDCMPEFRSETNTVIISIGKLSDTRYYRYKLSDKDDVNDCTLLVQEFISERGFAFMAEASHLCTLDQWFNHKPQAPLRYLYNQTHRCFKGTVIARFANNPKFLSLIEEYYLLLQRLGAPQRTIQEYDRMVSYLLHNSIN